MVSHPGEVVKLIGEAVTAAGQLAVS